MLKGGGGNQSTGARKEESTTVRIRHDSSLSSVWRSNMELRTGL